VILARYGDRQQAAGVERRGSRTGAGPDRSRSITPSAIEAANSRAVLIASAPEVITVAVIWMGAVSVGMENLQSAELATASPGSPGSS
jgi:hypothetical protein